MNVISNLSVGWIVIFSTIATINLVFTAWVLKSRSMKNRGRFLIIIGIWMIPLFGAAFAWIRLFVRNDTNETPDLYRVDDELGLAQEGFRKASEFMKSLKRKSRK